MIDLYQFTPHFNVPNLSPFCMKIEGFLRITEIPFQIVEENDPGQAPKGKLPFIRDNGILIGDSELIIDYLESKLDFHVDGHLDSQQAATHHAFIRMLDEHLYWALLYSRYMEAHNWETLRKRLFAEIPPPVSTFQAHKLHSSIRDQLDKQGMGRHNREEIYKKASKDLAQLSVLLGDHQWFGGDYVSKLDLTALAYLTNIMIPELSSPLASVIKEYGNLETYAVRARRIIFPDEPRKPKRPKF